MFPSLPWPPPRGDRGRSSSGGSPPSRGRSATAGPGGRSSESATHACSRGLRGSAARSVTRCAISVANSFALKASVRTSRPSSARHAVSIDEQPRGVELDGTVGEHELHRLPTRDRLAPRRSLARPGDGLVDASLGNAELVGRDLQPAMAELVIGHGERAIRVPEELRVRAPGSRRRAAHTVPTRRPSWGSSAPRRTRGFPVDEEAADPGGPAPGIGGGEQDQELDALGQADEQLVAVDDPVIAVANGGRRDRREVGPGSGLGERVGAPALAAHNVGEVAIH